MNADRFATTTFRKASGSGDAGCVEVAFADDATAIRDSKRRDSDVLCFMAQEWDIFLSEVKTSEL
jgi:hypothetical protein